MDLSTFTKLTISEDGLKKYLLKLNEDDLKLNVKDLFGNNDPFNIDIGCGNGQFLLQISQNNPNQNYLGIDYSDKRVIKSIQKVEKRNLSNVKLLDGEASKIIKNHIPNLSVSNIYFNFPDPWHKRRQKKRRLFCKSFLDEIFRILVEKGRLYIATDHKEYLFYMIDILSKDNRFSFFYPEKYVSSLEGYFPTLYEMKWRKMGREIYYSIIQKL